METRANHVLIGAFTLAVCLAAVLFALWAAKYTTEKSYGEYDVVFQEAVTGLSVGSQVLYSGISVGAVRTLSLMKDDPRKVVARIRLNADTPVKTDTRAKLTVTGLTGTTVIQLTGGSPGAPNLEGAQGRRDEVPVIPSEPSALQNIAQTASEIVDRVNLLLSDANVERFTRTMDQLDQVTGALADEKQEIAQLLRNARAASEKLDRTLASADRTINNLDANLVQELPELVAKLDRTLASLEAAGKSAEGILGDNREAIGEFAQDGLQQVGPTLRQLRSLIRELDDLVERVEGNPAGVILGREQPEEFEP
jgi:phospholipid/cholesterol/gamma-HCH transport system substrate-binding protein